MKYTVEERMKIGKEIYDHVYSVVSAAFVYGISEYTARGYLRFYKASINPKLQKLRKQNGRL